MKNKYVNIKDFMFLILGNLGYSVAYNCFFTENEIAAGGFGGIGLIVSQFLPVSSGLVVFVISIPVFLWSFKQQGVKYTMSALFSTLAFSAFLDIFSFLPTLTLDRPLAAICGGAIYGVSAAVLTNGRVAGSGTDLLARLIVTKFRSFSLGTTLMVCDGIVVLLSAFVFRDPEAALLATVSIIVLSVVMDGAIRGINRASLFEIIPNGNAQELAQEIMELGRGVTLIKAEGMYERQPRDLLLVVVRPREVYLIKDIIREKYPGSFVMLLPANEILGEGFSTLDVTMPVKDEKREDNK